MNTFIKILAIISGLILTTNCKTKNKNSITESVFRTPENNYTSIGGRIESLKQMFNTKYNSVDICVGKGKDDFASENFLLEVKLAYAMWIHYSNYYTSQDWKYLNFISKDDCENDNLNFSAASYITTKDSDESGTVKLSKVVATCIRATGCTAETFTSAFAHVGTVTPFFIGNDKAHWVDIELRRPSVLVLSPFVKWENLSSSIARINSIDAQAKNDLIKDYNVLLEPNNQSFEKLVEYLQKLKALNVVSVPIKKLAKIRDDFYKTSAQSAKIEYEAELEAFKTISHEVGHQFGLLHAHDPQETAINTNQNGEIVNSGTKYATNDSIMAYGKRFFYPTDDDIIGIGHIAQNLKTYFEQKKPGPSNPGQFALEGLNEKNQISSDQEFRLTSLPANTKWVSLYWGETVKPFVYLEVKEGMKEVRVRKENWGFKGKVLFKAVAVSANGKILDKLTMTLYGDLD